MASGRSVGDTVGTVGAWGAIEPIGISAWTLSCAAGDGQAALAEALAAHRSGLRPLDAPAWPLPTWVGQVSGLGGLDTLGRLDGAGDAADPLPLPPPLADWDCRPTRLAWRALQTDGFDAAVERARARWGAARVGVVLGTSASTIGVSEQAYRCLTPAGAFPPDTRNPRLNTPHALAAFVQQALRLAGPCVTVSTACSSSAKAFASAERWLRLGVVDAVVVGGVEALSASLLYGFRALGLVSAQPCRPFDARRNGISVGEAAGFALLQREPAALRLCGHGESNDAHHMSAPHPEGRGAEAALDAALARAGLDASAIDFVSLHGTATPHNDAVEAGVLARRYAPGVHACATKGLTGHTMGAAGIVEAAVCWLALEGRVRAGSAGTTAVDPAFAAAVGTRLQLQPATGGARWAANHAFGFGGNNCVLVFGRGDA